MRNRIARATYIADTRARDLLFNWEDERVNKDGKKEGLVIDLIEKRRKGEITEKEAYQEIYRRGLEHGRYSSLLSNTMMLLGHISCPSYPSWF